MSRNLKLSGALVAVVLLFVVSAFVWSASRSEPSQAATSTGQGQVVRDTSHVLGEPGRTEVTLVEFLDFECPSCGAFHPYIEDLRQAYAGQVTFVVRQFPLPMHANAQNAARAAEAAADQGQFEAMYKRLFETQGQWGNGTADQAPLFRTYADELGLDLAEYDAAVKDPATQKRIDQDVQDGTDLGLQGTPSFFLNGEPFEPDSIEAFRAAIDQALADAN
ncbi:hypothetical protein Kisp01_23870 [Kineosporia sp. NBRC 101677]|uniref:DsbA family protein n=1 Tax=Kineosporia sp. NBRC 101677 TaxID=3032197 RepID=UPI0024A0E8C8|nr:thioredoxin domain-containing protein [Kineosporia sp. NBRC 101677]GLY15372.1 hypothetical protein Kisp01_23870 [Kineosporia sp. NBRC 101677]